MIRDTWEGRRRCPRGWWDASYAPVQGTWFKCTDIVVNDFPAPQGCGRQWGITEGLVGFELVGTRHHSGPRVGHTVGQPGGTSEHMRRAWGGRDTEMIQTCGSPECPENTYGVCLSWGRNKRPKINPWSLVIGRASKQDLTVGKAGWGGKLGGFTLVVTQ